MSDVPPGWGLAGVKNRTTKRPLSFSGRARAQASASITRSAPPDDLDDVRKKTLVPPYGTGTPSSPTRRGTGVAPSRPVVTDGAVGVNDPTARQVTAEQMRLVRGFSTFFGLNETQGEFFGAFLDHTRGETIGDVLPQYGGQGTRKPDIGNLQGLSVRAAANFLYGLNADELTQFQVQLRNAGFFGNTVPTWGWLDQETRDAFAGFVSEGMALGPGRTVNEMMRARTQAFLSNPEDFDAKTGKGRGGAGDEVLAALQQPDIVPVTAASTLQEMVDQVAQQLLGQNLPREKRDEIVDQLQSKERQQYYATTGAKKQQAVDAAFKKNPSTGETELDAFAAVIAGNESDGNINAVNPDSGAWGKYQFMYWNEWAREAGVDPNDRSEAAQDRVAKYKMAQYYNAYGSWRDVAIAWYAGGGNLEKLKAGEISGAAGGDYPTMQYYGDRAVRQMQERLNAGSLTPNNGGVSYAPAQQMPDAQFVEQYDPETEVRRLVRAANPAGFGASQWKSRADAFFQMLGPVINYGF